MSGLTQSRSHTFVCDCRDALLDQWSKNFDRIQVAEANLEAQRAARGCLHEQEQQDGDKIKECYYAIITHLLEGFDAEYSSL